MKNLNMILNALFKGSVSLGLFVIALALVVSPLLSNAELKTIAIRGLIAVTFGLVFKCAQLILVKFSGSKESI